MSETSPRAIPRPPRLDPWLTVVEVLKHSPGQWHTIHGDASTATTNINDGVLAAFRPAGDYEARRLGGVLEVRYIDDRVEPDPNPDATKHVIAPIDEAIAALADDSRVLVKVATDKALEADTPATWCAVCHGTGESDIGRECFICLGTGEVL